MRVEQTMGFLGQSVRDIENGLLAPAPMQRGYVWDEADVVDFCKSVLDGLPIGSFTIWEPRPEDAVAPKVSRIGPVASPGATSLILDGHNRLATAAWVSHDMSSLPDDATGTEREVWMSGNVLCLDYDNEDVLFLPISESERDGIIRAHVGFQTSRGLIGWLKANSHLSESSTTRALSFSDRFSRGFMEQRVVITRISQASPDEARSVFLRVCKTGVPMSAEDFDRSLSWEPDRSLDI